MLPNFAATHITYDMWHIFARMTKRWLRLRAVRPGGARPKYYWLLLLITIPKDGFGRARQLLLLLLLITIPKDGSGRARQLLLLLFYYQYIGVNIFKLFVITPYVIEYKHKHVLYMLPHFTATHNVQRAAYICSRDQKMAPAPGRPAPVVMAHILAL